MERDVLCCAALRWFDPAIVAPRLAWLVKAVAFGGAGWDWDGNFISIPLPLIDTKF